jgi:hypothetical protein
VTEALGMAALAPIPKTEAQMVAVLASLLSDLGDVTAIAKEVRLHGRSRADLCAIIDGELVAVEVKRTGWRRALGQAALNRLCVDRSYIALWSTRLPAAAAAEATKYRIGVLGISNSELNVILSAPQAIPDPLTRARLLQTLEGERG